MWFLLELIVSILLLIGGAFALSGAIGMVRFPDFLSRIHGPSKTVTTGIGAIVLASILYFSFLNGGLSMRTLLISILLFITAPVSAHLLAKTALHHKLKMTDNTRNSELADRAYEHLPPKDKEQQPDPQES